ncbi:helix-turn-helix domain-containing protein [Atlantibacter sp.]|uniref:helix-turn-helix domain-containing protein n=1 Tax=Atlantibacter sp. TaxID=1903473 RepID=UPI0028AB358A|nr:helix-turn-helix domain-containing protein [Atlantibacter sp.]
MTLPQKPLSELYRLTDLFTDYNKLTRVERYTLIPVRPHTVTLIHGGQFSIIRSSDRLLFEKQTAPALYGLTGNARNLAYLRIYADTQCHFQLVPLDIFMQRLDDNHSLHLIPAILSWYIESLLYRDEMMMGRNSYQMIKGNLLHLNQLDEFMRSKINVADFIVKRTNLSRSIVMKVLSAMRAKNHIDVKRGKLLTINQLPEKLS